MSYKSIDFVNNLSAMKEMDELEPFLETNKKQFKGSELAGATLGVVGPWSYRFQGCKNGSCS